MATETTTAAPAAPPQEDPFPPARANPGGRTRKLTGSQWVEVIAMVRASVPVDKIAKVFHVQPSSIYRGLKRRRVNLAGYQPIAQEVQESAERRALIDKIKATKENDYKHTTLLQQLVVNTVAEAKRAGGGALVAAGDEVKVLKMAIDAVANGTKNKWLILGLDKENEDADLELPELPVREMSNDEVAALRDQQILEDEALSQLEVFDDENDQAADDIIEEGEEDPPGS
jgi:predicted DNA-binding protein YlxM (UPF0122 family)